MTKYSGKDVVVTIDDSGGTARVLTGDVASVDIPVNYDTFDATAFGDTSKNYVLGLKDSAVTVNGHFNDASNRSHSVLSGLLGGTTGYTVTVQPIGTTGGLPKFSGEFLLTSYQPTLGVDGILGFTANFVPFGTAGGSWSTN